MKAICYVFVILGAIAGGFTFLETLTFAESAPQQGAGAAMALAWVVLPYCFARAIEKIGEESYSQALEKHERKRQETMQAQRQAQPKAPASAGAPNSYFAPRRN